MRAKALLTVSVVVLLLGAGAGCGSRKRPLPPVAQQTSPARDGGSGARETAERDREGKTARGEKGELEGLASWYGKPYHGRKTASGEKYDMNDLTAAHRTLPFGTVVRVENKDNELTVVVRINDRGPFAEDRIIDLSRAAAKKLDMLVSGVAPVRLKIIREGEEDR